MKKKLARLAAGLLFGVLVAALTAEIALRIMVQRGLLPNRMVADIFSSHPVGWALEPRLHASIYSTNGLVRIDVNRSGFRDREYSPDKPDDQKRLLVLGDSFTIALETPQAETFHEQLEQRWGGQTEVIAMGVSGYEIAQEYLVYREVGRNYAPDTVLLMLYVGNDLVGNDRWKDRALPYFSLDANQALELHNFPYRGPFDLPLVVGQRSTPLMRLSRLAFVIGSVVRTRQQAAQVEEDLCDYQITEYYPNMEEQDWQLSEALILALRDAVEQDGHAFRVAIIPTEFQVEQADQDDFLSRCTPPAWALTDWQTRLNAFLEQNGIAALDLLPLLRQASQDGAARMYLAGTDIHWTKAGHAAVAQALDAWLNAE